MRRTGRALRRGIGLPTVPRPLDSWSEFWYTWKTRASTTAWKACTLLLQRSGVSRSTIQERKPRKKCFAQDRTQWTQQGIHCVRSSRSRSLSCRTTPHKSARTSRKMLSGYCCMSGYYNTHTCLHFLLLLDEFWAKSLRIFLWYKLAPDEVRVSIHSRQYFSVHVQAPSFNKVPGTSTCIQRKISSTLNAHWNQ